MKVVGGYPGRAPSTVEKDPGKEITPVTKTSAWNSQPNPVP